MGEILSTGYEKSMANAIRALSMDAVEQAQSGHVGLPLGMADVATVLFSQFLKFDANDPDWPDRDRFVLSAGHGSMLLYALLYLTGYPEMDIEEIRNFRQLGSKTPGHPEYGDTPGVETTTGPLGQGLATAVGMAMAERHLNAKFGDELVDHYTYVIAGDGCLMEGISQEAITLAGHLRLSRLIVLFDDNNVTIDGYVDLSDSTNQMARFEASGWDTQTVDGHDTEAIERAIRAARASEKPSIIACKTIVGYGAPTRAGKASAHGGPYGGDEIAGIREAIDWPYPPFDIPADTLKAWRDIGQQGISAHEAWQKRLAQSGQKDAFEAQLKPDMANLLTDKAINSYKAKLVKAPKAGATRAQSGQALEVLTEILPQMISGSADLSGSNNTKTSSTDIFSAENYAGRYVYYGIREHGMAAAMNGMALHGGCIPYAGTFLAFADYSRAAIRIGALMGLPVVHVMTHDSIGLGEDGPTHQPVEQISALRAIPNLHVFRPCDAIEALECWQAALARRDGPSVMVLTRQKVSPSRKKVLVDNLSARGGYVLRPASGEEKIVLIATGSEVEIALQAQTQLEEKGIGVRVVSLPCWEAFADQNAEYIHEVLGDNLPRLAIEAGIKQGWERWIGTEGDFIGMSGFGASAPYKDLYNHFGITADHIVDRVLKRV